MALFLIKESRAFAIVGIFDFFMYSPVHYLDLLLEVGAIHFLYI